MLGKNSDAQFIISFQRSKGKCNLLTKSKETKPILKDAMDFVFLLFYSSTATIFGFHPSLHDNTLYQFDNVFIDCQYSANKRDCYENI